MPRTQLLSFALTALMAVAFAGCSSDTSTNENTGSLNLSLELADGTIIDEVEWWITGNGMEMHDTINVSAPGSTASVEVYGLPPGEEDYTITLSAVSVDEEVTCEGSEDFNVEVGETTDVKVILNCKLPRRFGSVRVNGEFNICAELEKMVVSPLVTSIGNDIDLQSQAIDRDGDDITTLWSNDGGVFDDPTAESTTYTCLEEGIHLITVSVTDNDEGCDMAFWTVPVECVPRDGLECMDGEDCELGEVCVDNECVPELECLENEDCQLDQICFDNECRADPDLFCDTGLCVEDAGLRADCVGAFLTCLEEDIGEEEECVLLSIALCNECNTGLDCSDENECTDNVCTDGVCSYPNNDNMCDAGSGPGSGTCNAGVCEGGTAEIPLPMVVDDNYFGRSGFSDGAGGAPLHVEDNECPARAGDEDGLCHRFTWNGMGGNFTGTFWTDGEGFTDLNGLPVEGGATEVRFYAWSAVGGEIIEFGAGLGDPQWDAAADRAVFTLTTTPTMYSVPLTNLAGYTDVFGPFIWAANNANNPSGFEFYVDDIKWIQGGGGGPGCSDAIDFEDACGPYVFSDFGGGVATVIDNPDSSGINTTAKVAQMQKFAGEIFGGSTLALDSVVDWSKGTAFTMKVWASREVPVLFKLEGLLQERSATQTGSSSWEELCYDFTGTTGGAPANAITFIFDLGTSGDAGGDPDNWTFFFDGIAQTDGCGGGVTGDIAINGGFETGAFNDGSPDASWQQFPGGGTQGITTDNPSEGTYAANLNVPVRGATDPAVDNLIKNANLEAGNLTAGQPITVTWDMRGSLSGAGGVVFVELFSELTGGGTSKAEIYTGGPIFPTAGWESFTWNTTLGTDVSGGVTLQLKAGCGPIEGCGVDAYFDNVTITVP